MSLSLTPRSPTPVDREPARARVTSKVRWRLAPGDDAEALFDERGLRLEQWLSQGWARVVKTGAGRTVYRIDLPAQTLFLKHYRRSLRERLRHWLGLGSARREWLKSLEMNRRNVPTVRPIAWGQSRGASAGEQFFLTEAIPNGAPLSEALAETFAIGSFSMAAQRNRRRRALIEAVARLVAAAHEAGVVHDDLHAGNVLISDAASSPRAYLIDVPKVRFTRPLGWRASRDNLAMLCGGHLGELSRSELARFWKVYRLSRPRMRLADPTEAARSLLECAKVRARRTAAGRDRRPLRDNREFYRRRSAAGVGYAVREVPAELLDQAIADPQQRLLAALDRPLKLTSGSVVVRTEFELPGGRVEIAYKRYRPKSPWKRLLAWVRPSRATESWVRGHALLARGIATPRPLLACQPRPWRRSGASYLATEWVDGAQNLHLYAWGLQSLDERQRRRRVRAAALSLGRLIGRLHDWRISHHDLKGCNVLLADRGDDVAAYVIDLDGVRWHRSLPRRVAEANLARLEASAQAHPWLTRGDRLRFLRAYLANADCHVRDWKGWWRAVEHRSRRIAARLLRDEGAIA